MRVFEWNDQLRTGIAKIDEQHRRLVDLVNELADAMRERKAKDVLEGVLGGLRDYTVYHFAFEEKAFALHGYERAEEHAKAHASLVAKLDELSDKYRSGAIGMSVEVLNFLIEWVRGHIMKDDMAYVTFLEGKIL